MSSVSVKIEGADEILKNLETWDDKIRDGVSDAIQTGAFMIQGDAKRNAPVDTGLLRAHIKKKKLGKFSAQVTAEVHYAAHQEYGTRRMKAHPYLRPAISKNGPKIVREIKRIIP